MNLPDLCPRGLELYAEWKAWNKRVRDGLSWCKPKKAAAYQAYRQHVEGCELCGGKDD